MSNPRAAFLFLSVLPAYAITQSPKETRQLSKSFPNSNELPSLSMPTKLPRLTQPSAPKPTITAPPTYDPNGCRLLWIDFAEKMLVAQSSFGSLVLNTNLTVVITGGTTTTGTSTSGSGTTWTECDGIPRFKWTSTTLLKTTRWISSTHLFISGTNTMTIPDTPVEPKCKILPSDCGKQWDAFNSWSTQMTGGYEIWGLATKGTDWMRDYAYQDTGKMAHVLAEGGFDIDHLDPANFMGGCKIGEDLCIDVYRENFSLRGDIGQSLIYHGLTNSEEKQSAYASAVGDLMGSCRAHVGQFVLIYFPPTVTDRDICANKGKGTARTITTQPDAPIVTAEMTAIAIGTHTLSGDFKFTSPLLYLAYDNANVWRGCSRIGAAHGPGILTLSPGDLKSLSYSRVESYTPPYNLDDADFPQSSNITEKPQQRWKPMPQERWKPQYEVVNLADFQPPHPASAWFASKPYCRGVPYGGDIFKPLENCTETISEDRGLQEPTFAIPDLFTSIDPEWSSCSGAFMDPINSVLNMLEDGVRDPPIALRTASTLQLARITASAIATPRQLPSTPIARPTVNAEPGGIFAPIQKPGSSSSPQAVVDIGAALVTLEFLPSNAVLVGTNTLSANGPVATLRGQIVSLGSNFLIAGTKTIQLDRIRAPAFSVVVNGEPMTGYNAFDGAVMLGLSTLQPGGPALVTGGKTFSLGKTGIFVDGTKLSTTNPSKSTAAFPRSGAVSSSASKSKLFDRMLSRTGLIILTVTVAFSIF